MAKPAKPSALVTRESRKQGELRKAVDAIYAYPERGRLSLITRKAFNLLLARAMESGPEQEWYEIQVKDLARDIRYNSKDMKHLENTLNAMQTTLLKWDVLEEINGRERHIRNSIQLLGQVQIISGVTGDGSVTAAKTVRYTFNTEIKQRLLVPEIYARINLQLQNRFSSSHTLALYEQVIRYKGNVGADGWAYTVRLPWRDWRKLILSGDPAEIYEIWKYFRRDVIMKALKELNAVLADFEVEAIVHKNGKEVTDLQFRLRLKRQPSLEFPCEPTPIIDTASIVPRLERLGLTGKEIDRLITNHDTLLLEEVALNTETRAKRADLPPLKSVGAYFSSELKRIQNSLSAASVSKPGSSKVVEPASRNTERNASPKPSQESFDLEQFFMRQPEKSRNTILEAFAESLTNPAVVSEYARKGISSPIVRSVFIPWLRTHLANA